MAVVGAAVVGGGVLASCTGLAGGGARVEAGWKCAAGAAVGAGVDGVDAGVVTASF